MESTPKPKKKVKKSYFTGHEHCKGIGPDSPFVMLTKLPLSLTGDSEYKGHDCLNTVCPFSRKRAKTAPKTPAPAPASLVTNSDNLTTTIESVVKTNSIPPAPRPGIGHAIRFKFWQTSLGANIPSKSNYQKAKVVGYDAAFDLYEIELFNADYPFIPGYTKDGSRSQRIPVSRMFVNWESLADPMTL